MKSLLCFLFVLSTGQVLASLNNSKPVQTVEYVDLNRYTGTWYEVASIPQSFQKKCVSNSKAQYSLTKGKLIKVVNSCETKTGDTKTAEARAKVVSTDGSNSKLKVTFVKIFDWVFSFGGNYWIIALADDYSYAVVGDPTTEYAWILSRTPQMSQIDLELAAKSLEANGYDTCKLLTTIQDNGFTEKKPLCEVVSKN